MPPPAAWKRNTFNIPSSSHVNKTAYEEHSNAFAPRKKWSDLLKTSSSSSSLNIREVLEACYGAATAESDSCVVERWEDNASADNDTKEIVENTVQHHDGDSGRPNLAVMEASENTAFLDGWGEFQPSEFDSVQPREAFVDDKSVLSEVVLTDVQCFDFQSMITKTAGESGAVPTGQFDGCVSQARAAANLPGLRDSVDVQKQTFLDKNLNTQDPIALSRDTRSAPRPETLPVQVVQLHGCGRARPHHRHAFLPTLRKLAKLG